MKAIKCPVCVGDGKPIAERGSPCCEGKGWVLVPEDVQPTYVPYPVPYQWQWRPWCPTTTSPLITWGGTSDATDRFGNTTVIYAG